MKKSRKETEKTLTAMQHNTRETHTLMSDDDPTQCMTSKKDPKRKRKSKEISTERTREEEKEKSYTRWFMRKYISHPFIVISNRLLIDYLRTGTHRSIYQYKPLNCSHKTYISIPSTTKMKRR